MFCNRFILLVLISLSFSVYQVGDQISAVDQARNFDVCYGAEQNNVDNYLSLSDYNGYTNDSGVFYVMMINMAASW